MKPACMQQHVEKKSPNLVLLVRPVDEDWVDGNTWIWWIRYQMVNEDHDFDNRHQHDEVRRRPALECVCIIFAVSMMWKHFVRQTLNHPWSKTNSYATTRLRINNRNLLFHERLFFRHNVKVIDRVNFPIPLVCCAFETKRAIWSHAWWSCESHVFFFWFGTAETKTKEIGVTIKTIVFQLNENETASGAESSLLYFFVNQPDSATDTVGN